MEESPSDPLGGDHSAGPWQRQELLVKETLHIQMTPSEEYFNRDGGLEVPAWLLDCCDVATKEEEQSTPTFDRQKCVSSVMHGYK